MSHGPKDVYHERYVRHYSKRDSHKCSYYKAIMANFNLHKCITNDAHLCSLIQLDYALISIQLQLVCESPGLVHRTAELVNMKEWQIEQEPSLCAGEVSYVIEATISHKMLVNMVIFH